MDLKIKKYKVKQCSVRLPEDEYNAIKIRAIKEKVSCAEIIRAIVNAWYTSEKK